MATKNCAELVKERTKLPAFAPYDCIEYRGRIYQLVGVFADVTTERIDLRLEGRDVSFLRPKEESAE